MNSFATRILAAKFDKEATQLTKLFADQGVGLTPRKTLLNRSLQGSGNDLVVNEECDVKGILESGGWEQQRDRTFKKKGTKGNITIRHAGNKSVLSIRS